MHICSVAKTGTNLSKARREPWRQSWSLEFSVQTPALLRSSTCAEAWYPLSLRSLPLPSIPRTCAPPVMCKPKTTPRSKSTGALAGLLGGQLSCEDHCMSSPPSTPSSPLMVSLSVRIPGWRLLLVAQDPSQKHQGPPGCLTAWGAWHGLGLYDSACQHFQGASPGARDRLVQSNPVDSALKTTSAFLAVQLGSGLLYSGWVSAFLHKMGGSRGSSIMG